MEWVIADDLSGGAEIAGIAWAAGRSVKICLDGTEQASADVLVIDTDSRLLGDEPASEVVMKVCRHILSCEDERVFMKVDSVLRGNPVSEILAALQQLGRTHAMLISANPTRGRIVQNGSYTINQTPLHETEFANDPLHPAKTSRIRELVRQRAEILTPDVASVGDIEAIVCSWSPKWLPVGAADFYRAWSGAGSRLKPRPLSGKTCLWVCGSQVGRSERDIQLRNEGIPQVEFDGVSVSTWVDRSMSAAAIHNRVAMELGGDGQGDPEQLLQVVGEAGRCVVERLLPDVVLVEGGATARRLMDALGWKRFEVTNQLVPGVVVLKPLGVVGGPQIVVKPGSYSWPEVVYRATD